jgi:hypothetical protein
MVCLRLALSAFEAWAGASVPSVAARRSRDNVLGTSQSSACALADPNSEISAAESLALENFPFLSSEQDK